MENDSIEQLVDELGAVTPFKETTEVGDIVLIASEQPQLILYGIVTSIDRDLSKKEEWWHIGLTFFTVPLQHVVWTLRTAQMTGQEIFTMGGEKRYFKAVSIDTLSVAPDPGESTTKLPSKKGALKRIK